MRASPRAMRASPSKTVRHLSVPPRGLAGKRVRDGLDYTHRRVSCRAGSNPGVGLGCRVEGQKVD